MKYYQEPKDFCPIYKTCKIADTEECNTTCWKMVQMRYQLDHSNIPEDYKEDSELTLPKGSKDLSAYVELSAWLKDLKKLYWRIRYQGEGIFLYSKKSGNGKTTWATKIMFNYLRAMGREIETFEHPKILFVKTAELFEDLKASFENSAMLTKMLKHEERILNADLVIFDDIGAEKPSDWVRNKFYVYLNSRESNRKATIFTSNLNLDELEEVLGTRIVDRIYGIARRRYSENPEVDWRDERIYNIYEFKERGRR